MNRVDGDGVKVETASVTVVGSPNNSTITDLVRTITYTDAWGTVTTPTYDTASGRVM